MIIEVRSSAWFLRSAVRFVGVILERGDDGMDGILIIQGLE